MAIYVVKCPYALKVGYSSSVEGARRRMQVLQVGNPHRLEMLDIRAGDRADELRLHRALRPYRMQGEWFRDQSTVREILGLDEIELLPIRAAA